jgi:voltage-gated potassium channel
MAKTFPTRARPVESPFRQVAAIVVLILSIVTLGTLGFRILTGADWVHCSYWAVITLTTVGSENPDPLTPGVRLFQMAYLIGGLSVFTYSASQLGQWIVSAQLRSVWEKRRMERTISNLRDHYIVCGYGRMGRTICEHLATRRKPFVVIERDQELVSAECAQLGWPCLVGDATDDEVLRLAGIERAKALSSVLATDADNVYVVLSARMLAPTLTIIARASDEKAVEKMQRAGASRVVSPFSSGAVKMARFMLNPSVEDFLEIADEHGNELELADVHITPTSPYAGKTLSESNLREQGVMVIGIRRANGERLMPPPGTAVLEVGDSLFAFGSAQAVNRVIGDKSDGA